MDRQTFIEQANKQLDELFNLTNRYMKYDGDTCVESQRICLINRLLDVQQTLNGIEPADLV